jgi:hypothetical protein
MPLGQSKNPPAIAPVVFKNSRRDSAKSFIAFSLQRVEQSEAERPDFFLSFHRSFDRSQ